MRKSIIILATILNFLAGSVISQAVGVAPILHLDMESMRSVEQPSFTLTINGKDSIVDGISGKSRFFKDGSYLLLDDKQSLSSLWSASDFSIEVWVQTKAQNEDYAVIASNKEWNSGEIKDFTTNASFGISRTSGSNKGWAIVCQPDGSWAWNIGDGKYRLDYRPTSPRQQINDAEWHQIVFSIDQGVKEARMYFDGQNVAIYNLGGISDLNSMLPIGLGNDANTYNLQPSFEGAIDEFSVYDYVISREEVARKYKKYVPAAKLPELSEKRIDKLNLMAWNIWHGGRRHGREIGPQQVIDFIKDTGTDIVMMQETYGSGALIADALGYYFYLASTNISVISKYPILKTWTVYDAFRCGVTTIELSKKQTINLASLWIHYLPAWRSDSGKPDATAEKLLLGEGETRHKEIKEIVNILEPYINNANAVPLIVGGDFNSPTLKDWTEETAQWHNRLVVEWPVSKVMMEAGFHDSFREIRSDVNYASPTMSAKQLTYHIDYIYYKGKGVKAVDSDMHFKYKGIWPSDHPAVTSTFLLK